MLSQAPESVEIRPVPMACSSMVKDLFLLKALEAGADAVSVWVCPEGACRHVQGNLRAKKRVQRVQSLLEDIGLDGRRLTFFNLAPQDRVSISSRLEEIAALLAGIGKNPAGPPRSRDAEPGPATPAGLEPKAPDTHPG